MVSREGDLERKQYMVDFEEMLISDNMKSDIMVPGNGDPSPHMHTHQPCAVWWLHWETLTVKSSYLSSRRNSSCHVLTHDIKAICKIGPKGWNFFGGDSQKLNQEVVFCFNENISTQHFMRVRSSSQDSMKTIFWDECVMSQLCDSQLWHL